MSTTTEEPQVKTHRIVKLVTKQFQRIINAEIVPNRAVITLTGENGHGKSSVLNSIAAVLRGKSALPEQPIHRGASKSETHIDLGDFEADLRITSTTGARLTVKSKTGMEINGPQTFLSQKTNEILMDIVGFIRKGSNPEGRRQQAELLRKLVGLDFTSLNKESEECYTKRTDVGRELDKAKGKLHNYPEDPTAPAEEVKVAVLLQKQQEIQAKADEVAALARKSGQEAEAAARDHNQQNTRAKGEWERVSGRHIERTQELNTILQDIEAFEAKVAELRIQRDQLKTELNKEEKLLKEAEQMVAALVYKDEEAIRKNTNEVLETIRQATTIALRPVNEAITQADDLNAKVRARNRREEILREVMGYEMQVSKLTQRIDDIASSKQEQLANAKFPIEGLSFCEDGILYNGLPLSSTCTGDQIVAVAAIGFALKPEIRVAIIREASLCDQKHLDRLAELCEQYDGQAWLEDNRSTDQNAIVIKDGTIED